MGARVRIIGTMALAGILGLLAAYLIIQGSTGETGATSGLVVRTASLPTDHRLEGEALIGGVLQSLTKADNGGLAANGRPQTLTLRLRDDRQRYYDITVDQTISIAGLAPQTRLTIRTEQTVIYDAVPADWNGRIVLDAPPTAPFDITFSQNNHDYRMSILQKMGGTL